MIWFFIGGWICGAAAVIMVIAWWARTHMKHVTHEEMMDELNKIKLSEDEADD